MEGVVWQAEPDWRWAVDAARLMRSETIDWTGLVERSQSAVVTLPLREALAFLAQTLQAAVPGDVLSQLAVTRVSAGEARRFALISRRQGRLGAARRRWQQYAALAAGRPSLTGFVRFLEAGWALGSSREVLREIAKRGWMGVEPTYRF